MAPIVHATLVSGDFFGVGLGGAALSADASYEGTTGYQSPVDLWRGSF